MTTIEIAALLPWSAPKEVKTKLGDRLLRTAPATESFWAIWRANKETLKAAGISCGMVPGSDQWQVCWWQTQDPAEQATQLPERPVTLAVSRAADASAGELELEDFPKCRTVGADPDDVFRWSARQRQGFCRILSMARGGKKSRTLWELSVFQKSPESSWPPLTKDELAAERLHALKGDK
jgi:hypothetical protein